MQARVFVGLGANQPGRWGSPAESLIRALSELRAQRVQVVAQSHIYSTDPIGSVRQTRYSNAVIAVRSPHAPATLLRILKRIERQAGRRTGRVWGPRPLDLDVIDYGGRVIGWPYQHRVADRIVLPHPHMHERAFVLVPLMDIAPAWRHPALGFTARQLLAKCRAGRGNVRYMLDFPPLA
jgi:2-amino-4-hydroxy-6-hydroxymethyldihydropteridine diphosphokinase